MRGRDLAISVVLALGCVAAAYPDAVFGGASLVPGAAVRDDPAFLGSVPEDLPRRMAWDTGGLRNILPDELVAARAIRRGELPLWNPYVGTGMPLLGQAVAAPLSPFLAPFWAAPGERGYTFALLLRTLVAVVGTFGLARRLGISRAGSAFAGVAYALGGLAAVTFDMFVMGAAYAALPWLARAALRAARDWRCVPLLALATGLTILATHPELAAMAGAGAAMCALAQGVDGRGWLRLAAGFAGGVAVGAMQALPLLELIGQAVSYKKDPRLAGMFLPDFYLFGVVPEMLWAGSVPLVLAFLGATSRRREDAKGTKIGERAPGVPDPEPRKDPAFALFASSRLRLRRFLLFAAAVPALLMGVQAVAPATMGAQIPPRYALFLPLFALALLAGAGLDRTAGTGRRGWIRAALGALIVWGLLDLLTQGALHRSALLRASDAAGLALLLVVAVVARSRPTWGRALAGTVVAGWALILVAATHSLAAPAGRGLPESPARQALRSVPGPPARLAATGTGWRTALLPNVATLLGLNDLRAVEPLYPERYRRYLAQIAGGQNLATSSLLARLDDPLIDRAGVTYGLATADALPAGWPVVWHGDWVALVRNPRAVPRVSVPADVLPAANEDEAARLLAAGHTSAEGLPAEIRGARAEARFGTYEDAAVTLDVRAETRALVVLSDTFDPGWRAEVDGHRSPIYPTDLLFRGVLVEPGTHRIVMRYRPAGAVWGLRLSVGATLLCLLLLAARRPRLLV